MANTTKDIPMIESLANWAQPQVSARTKANTTYYVGQAVIKDANGIADQPAAAAAIVAGVVNVSQVGGAANATVDDMTLMTGEFLHFKNSAVNALTEADRGKECYFEDNQTVGKLNTAGSSGARFLGFEDTAYGRKIKVGVGPQYV